MVLHFHLKIFSITLLICGIAYSNIRLNAEDSVDFDIAKWLQQYNTDAEQLYHEKAIRLYVYQTNMTEYNRIQSVGAAIHADEFDANMSSEVKIFTNLSLTESQKRLIEKIKTSGLNLNLSYTIMRNDMLSLAGKAYDDVIVRPTKTAAKDFLIPPKNWTFDDMAENMATSRDYLLLSYVWTAWHNASGKAVKSAYTNFVYISNIGAIASGAADYGDWQRQQCEIDAIFAFVDKTFSEILPLYEEIYTYVRRKLREKYSQLRGKNFIYAHLLGNMWAQDWSNIYNLVEPFPDKTLPDLSRAMRDAKWNISHMAKTAESFYSSLGLPPLTKEFWNLSMLERPEDGRKVDCYADPHSFWNGKEYAVKMCATVSFTDFTSLVDEMGEVVYSQATAEQPIRFQNGANPGVYETVGDMATLSVVTPNYLKSVGLMPQSSNFDKEAEINFLLQVALSKLAFIPFGLLLELYRWSFYREGIPANRTNKYWWELRYQYQGMVPPGLRTEENFDPGAKYHVAHDLPYLNLYISSILQFQFHEALCKAKGISNNFHKCSLYGSAEAGQKLYQIMKMGSSRPWPEAVEFLTGSKTVSTNAIIGYFKPLTDWLKQKNRESSDCYGWGYTWPDSYKLSSPRCKEYPNVAARQFGTVNIFYIVTIAFLLVFIET